MKSLIEIKCLDKVVESLDKMRSRDGYPLVFLPQRRTYKIYVVFTSLRLNLPIPPKSTVQTSKVKVSQTL